MKASTSLVVDLGALDRSSLSIAGGKGANLGELIRAGFPVPDGFCLTTAAYAQAAELVELSQVIDHTSDLEELAQQARSKLLAAPLSDAVSAEVRAAYAAMSRDGEPVAVAVRSSATAEDLPDASFAGQQDTYLNVVGEEALLDAVRRCWASLWTERAVAYRAANNIDQRSVLLAVIVQRMIPAAVAGVLFTASPLTGRRRQAVIDAAPGLGEAVVSGSVNPDHFVVEVDPETIIERSPQRPTALSDAQALELARTGAAVEAHFQAPQDIEWAYDQDEMLWLLQSRPITTLYPLPEGATASPTALDVYFSANVAQGVLGPLTPAGLAGMRRIASGFGHVLGFDIDPDRGPSAAVGAAGRLFFKVTPVIRNSTSRSVMLTMLGIMEAQSGQIIRGLLDDPRLAPIPGPSRTTVARHILSVVKHTRAPLRLAWGLLHPASARANCLQAVNRLIESESAPPQSPPEAVERVSNLLQRTAPVALRVFTVALAGLASFSLARKIVTSTGSAEDALLVLRGLPNNPTTTMNLELWAVAAPLRQDEAIKALFESTSASQLAGRYLAGDLPARLQQAVAQFLDRWGFRGVAEIDLGVPRWRDDPTHIFGVLANYLRVTDPEQEPDTQFRRATAEAEAAIGRMASETRESGPLGPVKAGLVRFLFGRARDLAGLREMPKVTMVRSLSRSRELLRFAGQQLADQHQLDRADDIFFLDLPETRRVLAGENLGDVIRERRDRYDREQRRPRVPRILLSDGTELYGSAGISPDGRSLVGSAASPGQYAGPARVITNPEGAHIEPGEVLVAPSTDPAWTPLFMTAGALVMEMGGMMSHGSVVAREYGIPAVVGAIGATSAIQTGQTITVDGTRGVVILQDA